MSDHTSAGELQPQPAEIQIKAQPAVLQMTIHVTRAATGLTETYQLIGTPEEAKEEK
jgi:hypothetical protein